MDGVMPAPSPAAVLLRRKASELENEAGAVERGLRQQVTAPAALRALAANLRNAAERIAPGFRGE
jgi:hypothetical protein